MTNPFKPGDTQELFESGLYCETVIRDNAPLFVANALEDEKWRDKSGPKVNMINYQGFPLR